MHSFLVINDFNDINKVVIRHFSLDKGHHLAKSIQKAGQKVFFMTTGSSYIHDGIHYVSTSEITDDFVASMNYIMIVREPLFIEVLQSIPSVRKIVSVPSKERHTKIIVKSDSHGWLSSKLVRHGITNIYGASILNVKKWLFDRINYICVQNQGYALDARHQGYPVSSLIVSDMGISSKYPDTTLLANPFHVNHDYCVENASKMGANKALLPRYYVNHPSERYIFDVKKTIIVYTGRVKTDGGKPFYNMKNIMDILGEKYELHLYLGGFYLPTLDNNPPVMCSGKNCNSLLELRDTVFADSKNVIIHYQYDHMQKYSILYHANCGIDFSDIRPRTGVSHAGHAKILEYCESGLPVVCEEGISNIFLLRNGNNGIVLPYMASDDEYADAISRIVRQLIDRSMCRKVTTRNENWNIRASELLKNLSICEK